MSTINNKENINIDNNNNTNSEIMLKTVILIGGPNKGTRFRPLSLDMPKPLFPIAGIPMVQHHIEAASKIPNMKEIIIIGNYSSKQLNNFINNMINKYKIQIRYLQEFETLGTGGGLFHFRDQIMNGNPRNFIVMNGDVCCDFPLLEMINFHNNINKKKNFNNNNIHNNDNNNDNNDNNDNDHFTILATEATKEQSLNYGCIIENENHEILHYVEKPETFISTLISCGVYIFNNKIFDYLKNIFKKMNQDLSFDIESSSRTNCSIIRLEQDLFSKLLPNTGKFFVYQTSNFWSQVKSAGAAIFVNKHMLNIYKQKHPSCLATPTDKFGPIIIGDVIIDPDSSVHPTATIGPNVTISSGSVIGSGVRINNSIILDGVVVKDHSCITNSIVGWKSQIGKWARVKGKQFDLDPNKPFAKLDFYEVFNQDGRLNPTITVIGSNVIIPSEVIIMNCIVLPDKELNKSFKNQIIL